MDLFELEAVELLKPQRVTIAHDRSGSGWFLSKIIVKEARNEKQEFVFVCDKCDDVIYDYLRCIHCMYVHVHKCKCVFECCSWLDKDEGDQKTERVLELQKPQGDAWQLVAVTGGEEGKDEAMTCPVVLVVCGDKKQSKPIVFAEDLAFAFEPASEETFPIHVRTSLRCAALACTRGK